MPNPDPTVFAYERGSQATLISGATGTVVQVGTAKPATANAIGLPPILSRGMQTPNAAIQVDIGGTGSWTALTVNLLGSLDGIKFYVIATFTAAAGGLFPVSGIAQARYLSASITTATINALNPTATVSITL